MTMNSVLRNILVASALSGIASAQSDIHDLLSTLGPADASDPRFTNWQAPGPGDVRSPCPGLNTLANHGFINHNGRDLTIPHLISGLSSGLNVGADFTTVIGALGLLSSPNPLGGSFDLNDLDQHDFPIEHDGSLSRQDAYFGSNTAFNSSVFDQVLSYYTGMEATNTAQAAHARYHRINSSLTSNPQAVYGLKEFILSSGETGLYVQTMSNPVNNSAPVEYVKSLFEQEKLPYELGWRPSQQPITLLSLGAYVLELLAANPDRVAEEITFTAESYKDGLELIVGGTEILANLTGDISKILHL